MPPKYINDAMSQALSKEMQELFDRTLASATVYAETHKHARIIAEALHAVPAGAVLMTQQDKEANDSKIVNEFNKPPQITYGTRPKSESKDSGLV